MICPRCGENTYNVFVCSVCRRYMRSETDKISNMHISKKRTGVFYLTVGCTGRAQKTVTIEHSATIRIDDEHKYLEVTTNVDGNPAVTKVMVDDTYISRSDTLIIAEDGGKIKITQIPSVYCVNGEEVGSDRPALEPGDVINLSNFTYIKFDKDISRPAAVRGILSLVPEGFDAGEYGVVYDGKTFFDGVRKELMGCLNADVRETTDKCRKMVNRWILGRDLRSFTGGVR